MKNLLNLIVIILFGLSSCAVDQSTHTDHSNSLNFLVAGHSYGKPGVIREGLYPPFRSQFEYLSKDQLDYVFLTGDVVPFSETKYWAPVKAELSVLNTPYRIAPGNHDLTSPEVFESEIGERFGFFLYEGCLFILLDSVTEGWSIKGEQLAMFETAIAENASSVSEVFIFTHNMLWWEEDNQFNEAKPNWTEGKWGTMNYWPRLEPQLQSLEVPVYLFAGDFGATEESTPLKYRVEDNLHYVMSGMGKGEFDHYLQVIKTPEKPVEIIVRSLTDEIPNPVLSEFEIK